MNHHVGLVRSSVLTCAVLSLAAMTAHPASPFEGYLDNEALADALKELARTHPRCTLSTIGESRLGRSIHLLTLAPDPQKASEQPALLIAAGLDGRHLVGTEIAVRIARRLLEENAEALQGSTIYIVPRANPDAAEINFSDTITGHVGTFRPIDDDHDGEADEDAPLDVNGDGFITLMRRINPPLNVPATHLADPAAPRLLKPADPARGEGAIYAVYPEGLDQDGDGQIAEDGPGGVDLDQNFMRAWPEHDKDAGTYQLSEPESEALATFVLEHPEIVATVVYGRHDNLVKVPEEKGQDVTGRAPKSLHEEDVVYYQQIAERYREVTGQKKAGASDAAGSLHAWLYAHRGIPTFASTVWGRPEVSETSPPDASAPNEDVPDSDLDVPEARADDPEEEAPQSAPPPREEGEQAIASNETSAPSSDQQSDLSDEPADDEAQRESQSNANEQHDTEKDKDKPADEEAAAWLQYSDEARGGAGFVEWQPFDHPTLGQVEIGGFVPGFQMNPPADELDALAEKQSGFVVEVLQRRPRLKYDGPVVKRLADGLYEVRFAVINEGYLPTVTAMASQARTVPPTVIRLSTAEEDVVSGDRVVQIWGIKGSGERSLHRWIIRGAPGSGATLKIINRQLGDEILEFDLNE